MSKTRSPSYPSIGLQEAVEKVAMVYAKDYLNPVPKAVIANHIGYKSLSGASLPVIAALSQYGLLDGRGDETRVSDVALAIIAHEAGTGERLNALQTAAAYPELFGELFKKFPDGKASDAAIRAYLLTEKFIPAAADTAIRSYRETISLLNEEEEIYKKKNPEASAQVDMQQQHEEAIESGGVLLSGNRGVAREKTGFFPLSNQYLLGMREEKTALDEGEALLILPENLSLESVRDLQYWLEGILKKAKRRAGLKSPAMQEKLAAAVKANMIAGGADPQKLNDDVIAAIVDSIE